MHKLLMSITVACAMVITVNAQAGDATAGQKKAESCVVCHGMGGKSSIPTNPSLKGQQKMYLIKALKAYHDGKRDDPMMSPIAKGLSDTDIEDLATYFSAQ